jgi:hypothetical protein
MKIYDNAEGLRDVAFNNDQKDVFNFLRRNIPTLWNSLQHLDNSLSDVHAAYKCKGSYEVIVKDNE